MKNKTMAMVVVAKQCLEGKTPHLCDMISMNYCKRITANSIFPINCQKECREKWLNEEYDKSLWAKHYHGLLDTL